MTKRFNIILVTFSAIIMSIYIWAHWDGVIEFYNDIMFLVNPAAYRINR